MSRACPLHYHPSVVSEVILRFPRPTAVLRVRLSVRWPVPASTLKKRRVIRAKIKEGYGVDDDPFFRAAMERASLRYAETLRPDPLFLDPYIGCLLSPDLQMKVDMNHSPCKHCLTTKFIDDKLLDAINKTDGLRQVVLLTDGMDTRPYRLSWPVSTIIYDVSPENMFRRSKQKLEEIGAKIPKGCLVLHVPCEFSKFQQDLLSKGFSGARPSVWAIQGLPLWSLTEFEHVLTAVSNLSMKGCLLFGEIPIWLAETENKLKSTTTWVDELFMKHGLRVEIIEHDVAARNCEEWSTADENMNIRFVAEQLQYSDDQMDIWRREFRRMEEEADEEGFEEL